MSPSYVLCPSPLHRSLQRHTRTGEGNVRDIARPPHPYHYPATTAVGRKPASPSQQRHHTLPLSTHGPVQPDDRDLRTKSFRKLLCSRPRHLRQLPRDTAYNAVTRIAGDRSGDVLLPVLRGRAQGLKFYLNLVERREGGYLFGKYDADILSILATIIRPGSTVWDCGTYLGYYTAFFVRLVGKEGQVVAIEPEPRNMFCTQRNMNVNRLANISYVPAAVGAPIGQTEFMLDLSTNSHLPGTCIAHDPGAADSFQSRAELVTVRCISLDEARFNDNLPAPNFIKLDVEGAEIAALKHMDRLASTDRPFLLIESHNREADRAVWNFASHHAYRLFRLPGKYPLTTLEATMGAWTILALPPDAPNLSSTRD